MAVGPAFPAVTTVANDKVVPDFVSPVPAVSTLPDTSEARILDEAEIAMKFVLFRPYKMFRL